MTFLLIAVLTFENLLNYLLHFLDKKEGEKALPPEIADIYTPQQKQTSQAYLEQHRRLDAWNSVFLYGISVFVLLFGYLGKLHDHLFFIENSILRALAFFGIIFIITDILQTPAAYYATFVIEEKYNFNNTTLKTFILDKIKSYFLTAVLGTVILSSLLFLIENLGQNFWWYFWGIALVFIVFINAFYGTLIVPLFNKLTPLPDGDLRQSIVQMGKNIDFPLQEIYVMDSSTRSAKANAFFSGLGKTKKVVLYDTLLEQQNQQEILAILAHEIGHYKKNHIPKIILMSSLEIGLLLYLASYLIFMPELSLALGASQLSYALNLWAIGVLFAPISTLLGIFSAYMSRKHEYEADAYAKSVMGSGEQLILALKKLTTFHLANPCPHPLTVALNYSHPTLLQRIRALRK